MQILWRSRCCLRSTGSGADRDAGGTDYFIAGSTVCGDCAKSNSAVNAIFAANENVRQYKTTVPSHLQDAHYKGSKIWDMGSDINMHMTIRIIM